MNIIDHEESETALMPIGKLAKLIASMSAIEYLYFMLAVCAEHPTPEQLQFLHTVKQLTDE